jgi:hypothetical protein
VADGSNSENFPRRLLALPEISNSIVVAD